ncbi:MAG: hypothetical protein NVS2B7_07750 [Herpetosiphon sp.]
MASNLNAITGRLLVVDDNPMNVDMLCRRLEKRGFTVQGAESGQQALQLLEQQRFDLILLDIMMPGIDGLEVLRQVRQMSSEADLPVIMVTAKDASEDVVVALELGANDYVTKPIDLPIVMARVRTHLRMKRLGEIKDEFLRIASHDLKSPLSVVQSTAMLLKTIVPELSLDAEVSELLDSLTRSSMAMQHIIGDFLDLQAIQDGQLKLSLLPTNLTGLVKQVIDNNKDYAQRKGIQLIEQLMLPLPAVATDRARVEQVLENLVGNAIKFGFAGMPVLIRTRVEDDNVVVEVSDAGPGIKVEEFGALFVKYARLSNKPTGGETSSGLGLAISKQMVELHGGSIGARNNLDRGATFWFALPILDQSPR